MWYSVTLMDGKHWNVFNDCEIPGTEIMQFVGLKDFKGQDIYEGDILKYNFEDETHDYMPVFFKDGAFMTGKKDNQYLFEDPDPVLDFKIEVAGNIYEHIHLLNP
jgi:uncharacterized phage protein (TIGR01671 family)